MVAFWSLPGYTVIIQVSNINIIYGVPSYLGLWDWHIHFDRWFYNNISYADQINKVGRDYLLISYMNNTYLSYFPWVQDIIIPYSQAEAVMMLVVVVVVVCFMIYKNGGSSSCLTYRGWMRE